MGILNRNEILNRINDDERDSNDYKYKLIITPLLSLGQIGPASIDIRLGSSIIVQNKTYLESQDVTNIDKVKQIEQRSYNHIRLRYHSKFVLHPNELILGSTFEYISLPNDIFASIASRSSWGRLGLIIATASVVQPGFKGCLTLELVNLSESPIVLYPGLLIGQIVLQSVEMPEFKKGEDHLSEDIESTYKGRYECPTEAGLPSFFAKETSDEEMDFWRTKKY